MRSLTTSSSNITSLLAAAVTLAASAAAQAAPHLPDEQPDEKLTWLDPHTGFAREIAAQDRDYSVSTLFAENHGELLQQAKGYQQDVRFSFLSDIDSAIKGESGSFDIHEIQLDATYDFPIDPDSWMRVGTHVRTRDFRFSSGIIGVDDDERVWETGLILGGGTFLDPGMFLELEFEPGVYSDFEGSLKSDDWQFFGHARVTMQHNESLFWRFGARTDNTFEDLDVYPQLGLAWRFAEQWHLDVLLPNHIELTWNPMPELLVDAGLSLNGDEYHVRGPSGSGKPRFDWTAQEMRVYGGMTWRFTDQVSAFGRIGSTIGGDYEFNGTGGQTDGTPEGSFFFEVGSGFDW